MEASKLVGAAAVLVVLAGVQGALGLGHLSGREQRSGAPDLRKIRKVESSWMKVSQFKIVHCKGRVLIW